MPRLILLGLRPRPGRAAIDLVGTRCPAISWSWLTAPWWVPSSQRLTRLATRWTSGIETWAGSPDALMLVASG